MLKPVAILTLLLFANILNAQDITAPESKGIIQSLRGALHSNTRNLQSDLKDTTGTLRLPDADSLKVIQKFDSLKNEGKKTKSLLTIITDSLQQIVNLSQQKIDRAAGKVQSRIDSVVQKINRPVDDANDELAERKNRVSEKLKNAEDKVERKTDAVENKLQQGVSKATDGEMSLPQNTLDLNNPDVKIPGDDLELKTGPDGLPSLDPNAAAMEIPGADKLKVPEVKADAKDLTKKVDLDVPEMDKVQEFSGELNKADGVLDEAQAYEEELQNIRENGLDDAEKLPEELEKRAANIEEMQVLNKEAQKLKEYENVIQRYKDKKLLQEEIQRKAKLVANEKINALTPEVKNAQQELSKAKRINPLVKKSKEIARHKTNPMKGKPFRDRFVPGTTLQVYNNRKFSLDWAVQAGYKVSGRLIVGVGYTHRLGFDKTDPQWVSSVGISGWRGYSQFVLYKNFFAHGEFESLRLNSHKFPRLAEQATPEIYGSYFGLGRRYNISPKIKGSAAALYRVNYRGEVPGLNKITLRISFEYNLKKKKNRLKAILN